MAVGGVFPYPAAREAGVAVGLGTDGAGSNDSRAGRVLMRDGEVEGAAEIVAQAAGRARRLGIGSS